MALLPKMFPTTQFLKGWCVRVYTVYVTKEEGVLEGRADALDFFLDLKMEPTYCNVEKNQRNKTKQKTNEKCPCA